MKKLLLGFLVLGSASIFANCSHVELRGEWTIIEQSKGAIGTIEIGPYPSDFGDTGFGKIFLPIQNASRIINSHLNNATFLGKIYFEEEDLCGITYFIPGAGLLGFALIEEVHGYKVLGGLFEEEYMITNDTNNNRRLTWVLKDR